MPKDPQYGENYCREVTFIEECMMFFTSIPKVNGKICY